MHVIASLDGDQIVFSDAQNLMSGDQVIQGSRVAVSEAKGYWVLSYNSNGQRLYGALGSDGSFELFDDMNPSDNNLQGGCHIQIDGIIVTFTSDDDLMNNIWTDVRAVFMQSISSMPLNQNPRTKEVAILSMSHMSGLTNQSVDELASIIERYIGGATINVDPST